jgi:ABC-2 type transport system permease protein
MNEQTGAVFDLGYKPYEGERLGRSGAIRAIVKDGVRRVLGLRRKARRKVYPWTLVVLAILPAAVFVGLAFTLNAFTPEADSPFGGHAEYMGLTGAIVLLFVALAAPELLIPDREEGVLAVYSSRPVTATDYILARSGALFAVVASFVLVPNLMMYIGFAALDNDGLGSALVGNLGDMGKVLVAMVAYIVGYGAPALLIATYAKRTGPAAGTYLAIMFGSAGFAEAFRNIDFVGARFGTMLSLLQHPEVVRSWIFDERQDAAPIAAGFEPWASAVAIALVGAVAAYFMHRRYRSEL